MFFKRARATKAARDAVRPFIRAIEQVGGIPSGFWDDPYVVGFLTAYINQFAKLSTRGKISDDDLGMVIIDVFEVISGQSAEPIARRGLELQNSRDADYAKGVDNALKVFSVCFGQKHYDNDPDVIKARELSNQLGDFGLRSATGGPMSETARVGGTLQNMLFYQIVFERLGEGTGGIRILPNR